MVKMETDYKLNPQNKLALLLETTNSYLSGLLQVSRAEVIFTFARNTNKHGEKLQQSHAEVMFDSTVRRALAQSFIMNLMKVCRFFDSGKNLDFIDPTDRREFVKLSKKVKQVRDAVEHGYDLHDGKGGKNSEPQLHEHSEFSAKLDETALIFIGSDAILMGPLNLIEFEVPIANMVRKYGFSSLHNPSVTQLPKTPPIVR